MKSSSYLRDELIELESVEHSSVAPITIKQCLTDFSESNIGSTALKFSRLHDLWQEIVGKDVANHAHVRHIKNNVLFVGVDNPAWTTQLRYMHDSILERINASGISEEITSISMSVIVQK